MFLPTCFATITAIFRMMLQEIEGTNVVSFATITP